MLPGGRGPHPLRGFNVLSFVFSQERAFTFELVIGVLTAAIGIFALLSPDSIRDILSVVLGLVVIIDSLIGIKRAFTLRELELSGWWVRLTLLGGGSHFGGPVHAPEGAVRPGSAHSGGLRAPVSGAVGPVHRRPDQRPGQTPQKRLDNMVQDNIIDAD